ncbi:MAG: hypothetical protein H6Q15_1387 [Bacteroidetes bacterium]|nr:hypothetical protein [Bacteroidota bacterium]
MRNYSILIILFIIASSLFGSCVDIDDFLSLDNREKKVVVLNLNINDEVSIGEKSSSKGSKAPNNINDSLVSDIWVLQFDGTTTSSSLINTQYLSVATSSLGINLIASSSNNRIVIIANTHSSGWDWSTVNSYQDLLDRKSTISNETDIYGGIANKGVIMSGYTDVIVNDIVSSSPLLIDLTRSVAKVEFNLSLNSSLGITIDSIMLCDVPSEFHIADNLKSTHNPFPTTYPIHASTIYKTFSIITNMTGGSNTFVWYLPRNLKGTNASSSVSTKNMNAPQGASYLRVFARKGAEKVTFRIYPGDNMLNDFNITPNKKYIINIIIGSLGDYASDSRVEPIEEIIDYTIKSFSNCYIINPPSAGTLRKYRIPVGRVDQYWGSTQVGYGGNDNNKLSTANDWTISLLWQDANNIVRTYTPASISLSKATGTGASDYFEISVPHTVPDGNFVISIARNSSPSTILWSWHFWVTDYNPYYTGAITTGAEGRYVVTGGSIHRYRGSMWSGELNNSYALDRNIGQLSEQYIPVDGKRGILYYQYGRKDPFPANIALYDISGGTVPYTASANAENSQLNMANSVINPLKFFTSPNANNWCSDTLTNYIWNDVNVLTTSTAKSIFDPSPWGFKLPKTGVWSDFASSRFGWSNSTYRRLYTRSSVNAYYFADGYRSSSSGSLSTSVTSVGCYWNSSPNNTSRGFYMYFSELTVTTVGNASRANGFVCRPVRE